MPKNTANGALGAPGLGVTKNVAEVFTCGPESATRERASATQRPTMPKSKRGRATFKHAAPGGKGPGHSASFRHGATVRCHAEREPAVGPESARIRRDVERNR